MDPLPSQKMESLKVNSFILKGKKKNKTFTEHLLCARKSGKFHSL